MRRRRRLIVLFCSVPLLKTFPHWLANVAVQLFLDKLGFRLDLVAGNAARPPARDAPESLERFLRPVV
jgi:hypothetical protein